MKVRISSQRGVGSFLIIALLIASPSLTAYLYALLSGGPDPRPLAAPGESFLFGQREGAEAPATPDTVFVDLDWGTKTPVSAERKAVRETLQKAFFARDIETRFVLNEINGSAGVRVTFRIGATTIGPLPYHRIAEGVNAAVASAQMHRNLPRPDSNWFFPD